MDDFAFFLADPLPDCRFSLQQKMNTQNEHETYQTQSRLS
jgi:hypothetical protein